MHSGIVPWHRSMPCARRKSLECPYLIEGLKPFRAEIVPQLRQLLRQPGLGEKEHLRLSLAMVGEDESQVAYLYDRLLSGRAGGTARDPYGVAAALRCVTWRGLWLTADDPAAAKDRRFRALRVGRL